MSTIKSGYFALLLLAFSLVSCGGGSAGSEASKVDNVSSSTFKPAQTSTYVTVSGHISYDSIPHHTSGNGLNYSQIEQKPVRGVSVQAVLENNSVLATSITNNLGNYSLAVPENSSVRIRVLAQIPEKSGNEWDVQVVDNTKDNTLYVFDSRFINSGITDSTHDLNAQSGWGAVSYTSERTAAPFAILDAIYSAMQFVQAVDQEIDYPPLRINWSKNNTTAEGEFYQGAIGTAFFTAATNEIYLLGKEDEDTDEYDSSVILHEWGHYFEHNFSRSDSIGGLHSKSERLDMRVAFSEGWSTALASMILNDPIFRDSWGEQQGKSSHYSIENNSAENQGWYNEGSIQSILYDIFDSNNTGSDTVSLGFAPLYNVMTNQQRTTPFFASIFTFITALKTDNPDDVAAINALVMAQNIESFSIDATGSTETNFSNSNQVLPIYTELFLNGGPINLCMTDMFGTGNRLGTSRFIQFSLPLKGNYHIQVERFPKGLVPGDPDIVIYKEGDSAGMGNTESPDSESLNHTFTSGSYVMSLRDYNITNDISSHDSQPCYNITLTMQ